MQTLIDVPVQRNAFRQCHTNETQLLKLNVNLPKHIVLVAQKISFRQSIIKMVHKINLELRLAFYYVSLDTLVNPEPPIVRYEIFIKSPQVFAREGVAFLVIISVTCYTQFHYASPSFENKIVF